MIKPQRRPGTAIGSSIDPRATCPPPLTGLVLGRGADRGADCEPGELRSRTPL
jgi:hypothetical protein